MNTTNRTDYLEVLSTGETLDFPITGDTKVINTIITLGDINSTVEITLNGVSNIELPSGVQLNVMVKSLSVNSGEGVLCMGFLQKRDIFGNS
jgi:hypothetical protein